MIMITNDEKDAQKIIKNILKNRVYVNDHS